MIISRRNLETANNKFNMDKIKCARSSQRFILPVIRNVNVCLWPKADSTAEPGVK